MSAATVRPGQWLRFQNANPNNQWRLLEEIAPDPFGNPDMVVLKFSNGDGDRRPAKRLAIVDETGDTWWEVSETQPAKDVAIKRTASQWMAFGRLVALTERGDASGRWIEALLDGGRFGTNIVEIPAQVVEESLGILVPGVEVEVIVPELGTGVPGITEVRTADGWKWTSAEGIPVSRGFLDAYDIVTEADATECVVVAFVHPEN